MENLLKGFTCIFLTLGILLLNVIYFFLTYLFLYVFLICSNKQKMLRNFYERLHCDIMVGFREKSILNYNKHNRGVVSLKAF